MPYLLDTDCLIEALAGKPKVVSTITDLSVEISTSLSMTRLLKLHHPHSLSEKFSNLYRDQ